MFRIQLIVFALAVACGGGSDGVTDNGGGAGDGGAGDGGAGDGGAGDGGAGDGGAGDGGAGGADGGADGCDRAVAEHDPLTVLTSVKVDGGVTAAALSDDGASVITCESGAAKARSMADLSQVSDHAGACPDEPAGELTHGGKKIQAGGPRGLTWEGGQTDTQAPVYAVAPGGDDDHVVTASWDGVYLWDLGDPDGDHRRARELPDSGPVVGVAPAGAGKTIAFGPDGVAVLAVDPSKTAPDLKVDTRLLTVLCYDDGVCDGGLVVQNGGGAPLNVYDATVEGEGFSVEVEHSGFEDPPACTKAQAAGISGALVTVSLAGGEPAGEKRGTLHLHTNDPDEPDFVVDVVVGAEPLKDGDPAPDFRLPDLDGVVHSLSSLRGKVVHIKYLNAACVSCRDAIPVLEEGIWTPMRGAEPDFVPFVVHVGRGVRFAATTNDELGVIVPMVLDLDGDHFQAANQVLKGSLAYPLALLVDKEGKVRHLTADVEPSNEEWQGWIDGLLAE